MPNNDSIEEKIIKILKKEEPVSISKLARKLKQDRKILTGYLRSLEDRMKVKRYTVGKSIIYKLVE